jgi:Zn-dependent protease with chaperone function
MNYRAAFYEDSATAAQPVSVTALGDSLIIRREGSGEAVTWLLSHLRFEESAFAGGPLRVSSSSGPGLLMASDPELIALFGIRRKSGSTALAQGLAILLAASLALLLGGYFLFLPWFAGVLARRVPLTLEQQLGRAAVEQLAPVAKRCEDPEVVRPVRAIAGRLARTEPGTGYTFEVFVVKDPMVNALATPGGYIVVYTGLLGKTKTPEELAAVLGHEMTHVTERHSMTGIMRAMTFWVLVSYLIGDTTGMLVQSVGALSQLSYQRGQEEEADRGAMRLFEAARVDPRGLERAFTMLSKETPEVPETARFFSTHPRTADRLAEIRKWAEQVHYRPEPILGGGAPWLPEGNCQLK